MKILEMSIEGFKSYGERVKVGPFSPHFTAICGANGSGKSNFFDAICFAMGFRVGNDMRVDDITELIYQRGTCAAVTLVFDNTDKTFSPALYVDSPRITVSRQIVLRGRDRFFVNGQLRKPADVARMLLEAKLNTHNAHFLVLQGTVQQVAAMKPRELLSLFQEAVGTNVFDKERERSERILADKTAQLQRIEQDIELNLAPALDKARQEKQSYIRWMKLGTEVVALKYFIAEAQLTVTQSLLNRNHRTFVHLVQARQKHCDDRKHKHLDQLKLLRHQLATVHGAVDAFGEQPHLKACIAEVEARRSELMKSKVTQDQLSNELAAVDKSIALCRKQQLTTTQNLSKFESENREFIEKETRLKGEIEEAQARLTVLTKRHDSGKEGEWLTEDGEHSLSALIDDRKAQQDSMNGQLSGMQPEIAHCQAEISRLEQLVKEGSAIQSLSLQMSKLETLRTEAVTSLKETVGAENVPDLTNGLQKQEEAIRNGLNKLYDEEERIQQEIRALGQRFVKEDKIKTRFPEAAGPVLDIFRIKPDYERFSVALEEAGKSRLFNIVVDNDKVAESLFEWCRNHGIRVTCLPMNRINNKRIDDKHMQVATRQGEDLLYALNILTYNPDHEACLCSLFNVFVTDNADSARRLNSVPNWPYNSITVEGDCYNPLGQISGGSRAGMNHAIRDRCRVTHLRSVTLRELERQKEEQKAKLQVILRNENKVQEILDYEKRINKLKLQLDVVKANTDEGKLHECKERLAELTSQSSELSTKLDALVKQLRPLVETHQKILKAPTQYLKTLSAEIQKVGARKTKLLDAYNDLVSTMKDKKVKHAEYVAAASTNEQELTHKLEEKRDLEERLSALGADVHRAQAELDGAEARLKELMVEKRELCEQAARVERQISELDKKLEKINAQVEGFAAMTVRYEKTQARLEGLVQEYAKTLKGLSPDAKQHQEYLAYKQQYPVLLEADDEMVGTDESEWDSDDEEEAELSWDDGANDASFQQVKDLANSLDQLTRERSSLQIKIDKRAIDMLDSIESEFNELKQSQIKVESERNAVIQLIENIESQKAKKLQSSFVLVNRVFGHIMSTMLPGQINCYLTKVNEADISQGIEVNIEFNGVKKTGLHDLSGGQKSLLSLSYILALLKLNPCPIYILDEVDAALDIAHAQNLGMVIKKHFTESQFLIVSHRESLFKNADVVLRTRCDGGMSRIERVAF